MSTPINTPSTAMTTRTMVLLACCFTGILGSCSDDPATGSLADAGTDPSSDALRERDLTDRGNETGDLDPIDQPDSGVTVDIIETGDLEIDGQDLLPDLASDTPDGLDAATDSTDTADEEAIECPPDRPAHLGVHLVDYNQAPIEVNDRITITLEIIPDAASTEPGWLWADIANLDILTGTVRRNGTPIDSFLLQDGRIEIQLPDWDSAVYSLEGTVQVNWQLVSVRAGLAVGARECEVARSRSGALLQVIGGESKTPYCLDMVEFRSVQLAPQVPLQNTSAYREQNGQRTDLVADTFIFCPQNPTIVHATEFCLTRQQGQSITLAGHYDAGSTWAVDDFALIEVLEAGSLVSDGITTQTHPGDGTFWCDETQENPCPLPGCQAEITVIAEERVIEPIGIASAVGDCPRCFDDGEVSLDSLLPADGHAVDVRVTALDMGIEGELQPALYILSSDPE